MITLFFHLDMLCGTFTSIVDLYYNLRTYFNNIEFQLNIKNSYSLVKIWKDVGQLSKNITKKNKIKIDTDTLIISSILLTQIYRNVINVDIKCKNLFLLDSTCFFIANQYNYLNDLIKNIPKSDNFYFLGNPYNLQFIDGIEYYHKFSEQRLSLISPNENENENKNKYLLSDDYFSNKVNYIKPLNYKGYVYNRWFNINDMYYENIGKLLFEFNYFNKEVFYYSKNKSLQDGLHYYLKLFDIDDNKNQKIKIEKELLKNTLFFNENDKILDLLWKK